MEDLNMNNKLITILLGLTFLLTPKAEAMGGVAARYLLGGGAAGAVGAGLQYALNNYLPLLAPAVQAAAPAAAPVINVMMPAAAPIAASGFMAKVLVVPLFP